ncbi:MAG TPA: hypothetical protein H9906_00475 [Candidatus Paenalcaligenes intestinipullorum]|uniref:FAD-binding protein n=1 Tax=Candidatus Paenalcaligenes intestinipullorum TaxID=2838718 RepID=A0A9D2U938_9BURK|nr:hypothetical protein [Candidatus Paenalcaligenes intestinipullorum]
MQPSPSRRAFLSGRRSALSNWEQFVLALKARVQGELSSDPNQEAQLHWQPVSAAEVHFALSLCRRFDIQCHTVGIAPPLNEPDMPTLWVDPSAGLNQVQALETEGPLWFVQPGCTMQQLVDVGLTAFAKLPAELTVAGWVLDRRWQAWGNGHTRFSGVVHASLLMDDGTVSSLGPFGARNSKPLNTPRLRQLVPELFQLSVTSGNQACFLADTWRGRYRLDALQPALGSELNLAHLVLGSGGDLGWLEWLVIDERLLALSEPLGLANVFDAKPVDADSALAVRWSELDAHIKQLFDPDYRFSFPLQALL